jgi:uncharacterized repeat protein (TIGR04076 family)
VAHTIQLKILSQKGHCELGHQPGDIIICTEQGIEGKICIHALYSLMPKIVAMMYDAQFPWLENPNVATHACPDADNPVVFEVTSLP